MTSGPITSWQIDGETMETVTDFILGGRKSLQMVIAAMKLKDACSLEEKLWPTWTALKSRDITLPTKICLVKTMVFPVIMYGCDSWAIRKAECQRIDAFELWCYIRLLRILLGSKEIKPVNPKGNQPWIFIGRTDAEFPVLGLPDVKSRLTRKDLDDGKDWRQERGMRKDEMVGWHHWLNGHEFEQTPGGKPGVLQSTGLQTAKTRLSNWKTKTGFTH